MFVTQVVSDRRPIFANRAALDLLLSTLRTVKSLHPFRMNAYVFLPDHFHLLIRPISPESVVTVMHSLKPAFTRAYRKLAYADSQDAVWQERF